MIPTAKPFTSSTADFYQRTLDQMSGLRGSLETLQTQIATGQRIERGSDDPAGAARLRALDRLQKLGEIEADNAAKLEQDLTLAADQIGGVADLLIRARELALQGSNDTLDDTARAVIAEELEQLREELLGRANAQTLTGEPLFAGTAEGPAYLRDANGAVSYNGNLESGSVPIAPGTEIERGVTGPQVFSFDVAGSQTDAFALLSELAIIFRGGSADAGAAALAAIDGIDAGIDTATRNQAIIGTRAAWVDVIQQNQIDRGIELAEQRSEVADTDLTEAIARLQQTLTALEASQASFVRVSSLTLFDAI